MTIVGGFSFDCILAGGLVEIQSCSARKWKIETKREGIRDVDDATDKETLLAPLV
tara:strand:+ start:527 stop:691 length:165 start_codon:yes stop_codon:yes gene_type:complete